MNKTDKIFDAMLVLEYQSGGKKALTLLVKRWHQKLYSQARWYTKDDAIAKDVVQDSWSIIIKRLHGLKDPNVFGSWAMTIVTRKAIDWTRAQKKELNHLKSYHESTTSTTLDTNTLAVETIHSHLNKHVNALSLEQQMVLKLFYLNGHSLKEISSILQKPVGTIKSRLFTARENLKEQLKTIDYEK